MGLDVFFVISGYLITGINLREGDRREFSFAGYYARRVRRIFPALLAVLVTCLVAGWFLLVAEEFAELGKEVATGSAFVSNISFWSDTGYFDDLSETKVLLHLWSLSVEEQFYLVWPLLIFLIGRRNLSFGSIAVGLLLVSLATNLVLIALAQEAAFFWPFGRLWEFLAGGLLASAGMRTSTASSFVSRLPARLSAISALATAVAKLSPNWFRHTLSLSGAVAILWSVVVIEETDRFPGGSAIAPVTALIAAGPGAMVNRHLLANPIVVFIGLVSYPLYLWHWPLISFLWIHEGAAKPDVLPCLAVGIAVLVLAFLTYWLIERPIRRSSRFGPQCRVLVAMLVAIFLGGLAVMLSDGLPDRDAIRDFTRNSRQLQRTASQDDACLAYIGASDPLFPYCRFSDTKGRQTVAIVGESHAHESYAGIASGLAEKGINTLLLANSGCPHCLVSRHGLPTTTRSVATFRSGRYSMKLSRMTTLGRCC